jgi:cyanate permease
VSSTRPAAPAPTTAPAGGTAADRQAAGTHPYRWIILAGAWLVYYSFSLTTFALAPLVHLITPDLHMSHAAMGSVLGAWQLMYIFAAIPCGAILDRFGPWRSMVAAMLVISLSGVVRGVADSYLVMFLAVALFGVGGPLVSTGAPKLIALWFVGQQRGTAMGIYFAGNALGAVTALSLTNSVLLPLLGGSWRAVLIAYAAFTLIAGIAWLAVGAHPASRALERSLTAGGGEKSFRTVGDLLRVPAVRIIIAMGLFLLLFNHSLNNWLPEMLRSGGMDSVAAGFWSAVPTSVGIVSSLILPRLATPSRRAVILGTLFLAMAAAMFLIATFQPSLMILGLVFQGTARGAVNTITVLTLMEHPSVGPRRTGSASGLYFAAAEIGGMLGPLSIGAVVDATGGFSAAFHLLAADCAVLLLLLVALRRTERRT